MEHSTDSKNKNIKTAETLKVQWSNYLVSLIEQHGMVIFHKQKKLFILQ